MLSSSSSSSEEGEDAKLNRSNSNWESDLIPDELKPSARTLYLIYIMCKKYKDLASSRDVLKDMWCEGDLKLMDAIGMIERGRVDRCYRILKNGKSHFQNDMSIKFNLSSTHS